MLGTYALLDSGPFVFEITSPNFFFGLVGLLLLGFTFSLASNSARLALADASGGLVFSYFVGEPISVALQLIEGIFVPNPVEALVVYGAKKQNSATILNATSGTTSINVYACTFKICR